MSNHITREQWTSCREDYIRGRGSLAIVAARHGLRVGSVERRARQEHWTKLRAEYEAAQLAKLIPAKPQVETPVPIAVDGAVSERWLAQRQEIYYRKSADLIDKTRALLAQKLDVQTELSPDALAKLTSALGGLVDAEIKLLGLNRRSDKKRPRRWIMPIPEPIPSDDPQEGCVT